MDVTLADRNNERGSTSRSAGTRSAPQPPVRKKSVLRTVLVIVAVVLVLAVGGWLAYDKLHAQSQPINTKGYQAVFLTNGQVYFGKLQNTEGRYLSLKNIYYLQVQQAVQPADTSAAAADSKTQLVKLGNELHGPEDSMQISHDQILFWENLTANGKVSQAIASYKP